MPSWPVASCVFVVLLSHQSLLADGWTTRYPPPTTEDVPTTAQEPSASHPELTYPKPGRMIEQSSNITIRASKDTTIICRTDSKITSCAWLWELPRHDGRPTVIAVFPGHGQGSTDCSVDLVNVSNIQTGWWTCQAQMANTTVLHAKPVYLDVFTGPVITFDVMPVNRTYSIGKTAELECNTSIPVHTCQWSFQQRGQTEPLVVFEGPPKNENDCSFKLEHISYEQVGKWKCGARTDDSDDFTFTPTVFIDVEHKEEAFPVEFIEEPNDTQVVLGKTGRMQCKVREDDHIEDCRWYWQPLGHSHIWSVLMREFLPINNDCTIEFFNITADPEGFWTCHVKPIHSMKFKASRSARLSVREERTMSTLTREVRVFEGEPVTLQCIAEEPAKACQWKQKPFSDSSAADPNSETVIQIFEAAGNDSRDCSLHIDHAQMENQGLWICSVRFLDDDPFFDAMPTVFTVMPPNQVQFVANPPRAQLAAENGSVTLHCSTLSPVNECVWKWYEKGNSTTGVSLYNYPPQKNKKDCSIVIPKVDRSLQGIWQCVVQYGNVSNPNTSYARPFSLTVVKVEPIVFRSVSLEVHSLPETTSLLECVTRDPVEECLWLYQSNQTSEPEEFTRFEPSDFNNCSLKVSQDMSSGLWTCGARNPGETNFTMASPSRMNFVSSGNVSTWSFITSSDTLLLVCQLSVPVSGLSCDWIHPSNYNVIEFNNTGKYVVEERLNTGVCSLSFRPMLVDVGHWKCIFSVNGNSVLGESSFTVLSSPQNVRLSWVVGILATVTLLLTVLLFVVLTCRFYQCTRSNKATVQLNKPLPENNKRYSEDPTKGINFSFTENPELLVDFSIPPQGNHHYERVGRYAPQKPNFYQNVD